MNQNDTKRQTQRRHREGNGHGSDQTVWRFFRAVSTFIFGCAVLSTLHMPLPAQCSLQPATHCNSGMCTATIRNTPPPMPSSRVLTSGRSATCAPAGQVTLYTIFLHAAKTSGAFDPRCAWSCCGIPEFVDMTVSDGLPVELLDFSIEAGDTTDGKGEVEEPETPEEASTD